MSDLVIQSLGSLKWQSYPMASSRMGAVHLCPAFHREQTTADMTSSTAIWEKWGHDYYDGLFTLNLFVISRDLKSKAILEFIV